MGRTFLVAGSLTFLFLPDFGLPMMAVTFGGFHIIYALAVARRKEGEEP